MSLFRVKLEHNSRHFEDQCRCSMLKGFLTIYNNLYHCALTFEMHSAFAHNRTQRRTVNLDPGRYWTKEPRRVPPKPDSRGKWTSGHDTGPSCLITCGGRWMRFMSHVNLIRAWWSVRYDVATLSL